MERNEEFHFPTINTKATGARIRRQRLEKHITVQHIQNCMGFSEPQAIYKWQRGDSLPSLDNLIALAKLFDTTMEDILVIDDGDVFPPVMGFFYFDLRYNGCQSIIEGGIS
jgi:transcriptional regulator with XRE-family HTH domain